MATRRPLVIVSGAVQELPTGDTLPGGSGSGDIVGPASATNNAVALFDGTTGKLIKDSTKTLPTGAVVGTTDTQTLTNKTIGSNLNFSGTGLRLTGDFSNATFASRLSFQTNTVNGATTVSALPNGTSTTSLLRAYNNSDPTNAAFVDILAGAAEVSLRSGFTGTGASLPLTFYTGVSERLRIATSGNLGIGTSNPASKLTVQSGNIELKGAVPQILFNTNTPANNFWIAANISDEVQDGIYIGKGGTGGGVATSGSQNIIKLDSSNNVLVTGGGGLGYGIGSGGTVTQATSKSTTVTLNKPVGRITTAADSLGAGENVQFVVNNTSFTSASDLVLLQVSSVGYKYDIWCHYRQSGRFDITLKNITAGALAEAVAIDFAVIKGATA